MAKVVVVGAGVVGLSVARAARLKGHDVTVLEQGPAPNPQSASYDRHRMIRYPYGDASGYTRMVTDAFRAWDRVWTDIGARHFEDTGAIAISIEPGDYAAKTLATFRAIDIPHQVLQRDEIENLCPHLTLPTHAWAVTASPGGPLFADRIVEDLAKWLRAHQVSIAGGVVGCGTTCTELQTCCTSTCADLSMDPLNCGTCGSACNSPRVCGASACKGGWVGMSTPPASLVARSRAAVVAMGKRVFFWGGQDTNGNPLKDGAIYTPLNNSWTYLPFDTGVPTARIMATAVWTGSVVIVFGGSDVSGQNFYRDGAVYDPGQNSWSALPASNSIKTRSAPYGYWDGTRSIFWSGMGAFGAGITNVDRFDMTSWSVSKPGGDPGALIYPATGFDGSVMYVFGGQLNGNRSDKGYTYTASSDIWAPISKTGFVLSPRSSAFGAWDGTRFVVWGGRDDNNGLRSDGQYFSGGKWTSLSTGFGSAVPSARLLAFRRSGWAFQTSPGVVAFIGGQTSIQQGTLTTTGASYNVALATWTTIPQWPSMEPHEYGMGAWTGEEFVLWGGRDNNGVSSTGERWAP